MVNVSLYSLAGLAVSNAASASFSGARTHIHLTRQAFSSGAFDSFEPSTIPPQCQNSCNTFSSAVASCKSSTQASCGCSTATEQGLVTCLNCIIGLDPADAQIDAQSAQVVVDGFVQLCGTAGVKLPATTVSGGVAGTPTATPNGGGDISATVTSLSPTTSHDAGDDHGGSSGSSGSGSSNSGNSNSSNSTGGSGNTDPPAGSSTGAASWTLPGTMASVGLVLVGVFFTL